MGQVILNMPNSMAKAGLALGSFFQLWAAVVSLYTLWLLSHLYQEFKRSAVSTHVDSIRARQNPVLGSSAVCSVGHPGALHTPGTCMHLSGTPSPPSRRPFPAPCHHLQLPTPTHPLTCPPHTGPLTHPPHTDPLTHPPTSHTAAQIKEDTWYTDETGTRRNRVTQYHDVIGGVTGRRWLGEFARVVTIVELVGLCVAQIIAGSSNLYSLYPGLPKR